MLHTWPFQSLSPSEEYMCQGTESTLVKVVACCLCGDKPWPCPEQIYCQYDPGNKVEYNFGQNANVLLRKKCVWIVFWKCPSMCLWSNGWIVPSTCEAISTLVTTHLHTPFFLLLTGSPNCIHWPNNVIQPADGGLINLWMLNLFFHPR